MSRVKTIGSMTVLSLVLLGVLVALAQTSEKPPTELYVRTTPAGAAVFVDGKEVGTAPSLLEVEPGDHSITVKLDGHQPGTRTVTIPEGRIRRVILRLGKEPGTGGAAAEAAPPVTKPRHVILVHADRARDRGIPAVLDLASGELIAQPKTADDAVIAKYWDQLGRGDLAYPGEGLMVLRRGTVEQWNPATKRYEAAKAVYQEPRGAAKPLATGYELENLLLPFRITTGDGKKFEVTALGRRGNRDWTEIEYRPSPQSEDESGWGPAVQGVQCRVRAEKPTWPQGSVPKLLADLRNQGQRNRRIALESESWEIEIDGTWHRPNSGFSGVRRYLPLGPGQQQQNLEVWIPDTDNLAERLRALPPGKHTLRVARLLNSSRAPGEEILRLLSNPIEIEIVPAEARPKASDQEPAWRKQVENPPAGLISTWPPPPEEPAWGKQVENLQCRIRAEKAAWAAGTVPKLFGDLRSYDMWHPDLSGTSENWEIEIDGKWHKNQRAKLVGSHHYTATFLSGNTTKHDVHEVVYQLAIDAEQTAARSLRALAPGKHVLRAGYQFGALPPDTAKAMSILKDVTGPHRFSRSGKAVRVVSNPIEIEIVPAGPAAVPNTSSEISGTPPEPKPRKTEPLSFGPVIERVVNDDRTSKDWLIDLDTGTLYTRPENFRNLNLDKLHAWARRVGIDASGVKASEGVLAGSEIGAAAIMDDASWEEVTPQAVREALKQPDPRLAVRRNDAPTMIRLGGKGVSLETVYAFQTREGGVGVLQLLGPGDKDRQSVKIRYKLVSGTSASPPADQVWTCPMHPQVNVPKPGKCPTCAMDLVARPPRSAAEQAVRELISNFVEAVTRNDRASVAKFLSKRSHQVLEHAREIMSEGINVAEISFVVVAHGRALAALWRSPISLGFQTRARQLCAWSTLW